MATPNFPLLFLAFSLLAVSAAAARPCKILFFTTTSYYHQFPTTVISQNPNPNPNYLVSHNPNSISPRFRTFFFTTTGFNNDAPKFRLNRAAIFFRRSHPILIRRPDPVIFDPEEREELERRSASMFPVVEFYSSVTSSIRDRSKDIMRVVGAMLFGVGCGALTAATMYLIWSLFWPNQFDFEDSDDYDDDVSAKKMGYVVIPNKVVDDDLKKAVGVPTKEAL